MSARLTMNGQPDPGAQFARHRRAHREAANGRAAAFVEGFARQLETHMVMFAPWSDETGDARRALYVEPERDATGGVIRFRLIFGYRHLKREYGFWLETKRYEGDGGDPKGDRKRKRRRGRFTGGGRTDEIGAGEWGRDAIIAPTVAWAGPALRSALHDIYASPQGPGGAPLFKPARVYAGTGAAISRPQTSRRSPFYSTPFVKPPKLGRA